MAIAPVETAGERNAREEAERYDTADTAIQTADPAFGALLGTLIMPGVGTAVGAAGGDLVGKAHHALISKFLSDPAHKRYNAEKALAHGESDKIAANAQAQGSLLGRWQTRL